MIKNSKQYQITKEQAEKFKEAIAKFNSHKRRKQGINEQLIKAELAGLKAMYEELLNEMLEYENRINEK